MGHRNVQKCSQNHWKVSEPNEPAAEMMLQGMKGDIFAETLRKLEDPIDDAFFVHFFLEIMAKIHKVGLKFKTLVHEIYSKPLKSRNIA